MPDQAVQRTEVSDTHSREVTEEICVVAVGGLVCDGVGLVQAEVRQLRVGWVWEVSLQLVRLATVPARDKVVARRKAKAKATAEMRAEPQRKTPVLPLRR